MSSDLYVYLWRNVKQASATLVARRVRVRNPALDAMEGRRKAEE